MTLMTQPNLNIRWTRVALASVGLLSFCGASAGVWRWRAPHSSSVLSPAAATTRVPVASSRQTVAMQTGRSTHSASSASGTSNEVVVASLGKLPLTASIPLWAQGKIVRHVPVQRGAKVIALTFDDGPWPRYTKEVLQVLASRNVKATFFMIGREVQRRPDLVREVRDAGHSIGNHSWDHARSPRNPGEEVFRTDATIKKALGVEPFLFRPPYGKITNGMAAQAMRDGQCVVIWNADSNDWKHATAASIAQRILRQASPGGIALMHDGGGNRGSTVAALPRIIDTLRERGYRFVTVPQLLALRHVEADKGHRKHKARKAVPADKTLQAKTSHRHFAKR